MEFHADLADKTFTVNGAITPAEAGLRFFLTPVVAPLVRHIERSTFFMLYGPRGAGKTTTALHALRQVQRVHGWRSLKVDLSAVSRLGSIAGFWRGVGLDMSLQAARFGIALAPIDSADSFRAAFSRASLGEDMRLVLMLDEFDTLDSAAPGIKEEVR